MLPATLAEEHGAVVLRRACPAHGELSSTLWRSAADFEAVQRGAYASLPPTTERAATGGCPTDCGLCARHQTRSGAGLLEVTDRCDLGCPVCFARATAHADGGPTLDECLERLRALRQVNDDRGPTTLQLIGGEPTMRDDLPEIVAAARGMGFGWMQLATNGLRLSRDPELARDLARAGLHTLYLQFDGLSDESVRPLRQRAGLVPTKLACLEVAAQAGLDRSILTMTVARGVNDHQVGALIDLAVARREQVLGIIYQPMAHVGRSPGFATPAARYGMSDLLADVAAQTGGRVRPGDWMSWGAYTPLVRYFLDSPLEHERVAEVCPDPLCGLHTLLIVEADGSWRPITDYFDPRTAAETLERALAQELAPGGRLAQLGERAGLLGKARQLIGRQVLGSLVLRAMTTAASGRRSLDDLLRSLRLNAQDLIGDEIQFMRFLSRGRQVILLSAMDFMDPWTMDLERLRRCTVHYATASGPIPFCAMNTFHRAPGPGSIKGARRP